MRFSSDFTPRFIHRVFHGVFIMLVITLNSIVRARHASQLFFPLELPPLLPQKNEARRSSRTRPACRRVRIAKGIFSYPGTRAPSPDSRLPSLRKNGSGGRLKEAAEMQEEAGGTPDDGVKFTSITEQATSSTGHLGCGNPNSSLFFCDDNLGE